MAEEKMRESAERDFQANIRPLERVTSFKYLGWVLTEAENDCKAVVRNLKIVQSSWE